MVFMFFHFRSPRASEREGRDWGGFPRVAWFQLDGEEVRVCILAGILACGLILRPVRS